MNFSKQSSVCKKPKGLIPRLCSSKKINAGFTLVEVIVAVGIFSLVMMIAIGAVLSIVGANKKAQSLHNVINSLNLAVESMVRDMRTGYDYECDASTSDCSNGTRFSFKSMQMGGSDPIEIEYSFDVDEHAIYKSVGGQGTQRLTSEDVFIEKLAFYSTGLSNSDDLQPLVRVVIQGNASTNGQVSRFDLQTLVSERILDIPQ